MTETIYAQAAPLSPSPCVFRCTKPPRFAIDPFATTQCSSLCGRKAFIAQQSSSVLATVGSFCADGAGGDEVCKCCEATIIMALKRNESFSNPSSSSVLSLCINPLKRWGNSIKSQSLLSSSVFSTRAKGRRLKAPFKRASERQSTHSH